MTKSAFGRVPGKRQAAIEAGEENAYLRPCYLTQEIPVKTRESVIARVPALAVLTGLSGCCGMSRREQNTVAGAGIGGVAGALLTHGSAIGTVGGAGGRGRHRPRDRHGQQQRQTAVTDAASGVAVTPRIR